jgi:hypothetical protein
LTIPAEYELVHKLGGGDFKKFVDQHLLGNNDVYHLDAKTQTVMKRYNDGA